MRQKSHVAHESTPYWILKHGCCSLTDMGPMYIKVNFKFPFQSLKFGKLKSIPIGWFGFELSNFLNHMVIIYQLCLKSICIETNFQGFSKSTIPMLLLKLMKV